MCCVMEGVLCNEGCEGVMMEGVRVLCVLCNGECVQCDGACACMM